MQHPTEAFMSAMILDGVLEKFPRLRGASVEQGAKWVVPWLKKLDIAQEAFRRFESYLNLPMELPTTPGASLGSRRSHPSLSVG
jgi:hypothetical protein